MERIQSEIRKGTITQASLYEQLAEECTELAHASLKAARILRGESPTPVRLADALKNVDSEFHDLITVSCIMDMDVRDAEIRKRAERWAERIGGKP